MGAAIEQKVGNEPWKPLAFFSRKFSGTQLKYSTYDRELTAMHESLVHFKDFLEGCDFEIHTDHESLTYEFLPSTPKTIKKQNKQQLRRFLGIINYYRLILLPMAFSYD